MIYFYFDIMILNILTYILISFTKLHKIIFWAYLQKLSYFSSKFTDFRQKFYF